MAKPKSKISIDDLQNTRSRRVRSLTTVILGLLIAVGIIAGLFAIATSVGRNGQGPEVEQTVRSLSGKSLAEDRADAIQAAADLLGSTNAPPTIAEASQSIEGLEAAGFSSFEPNFAQSIRYYDAYESNSDFQSEVAMSLYSLAALAKEAKGGEISADGALSGTVRVDQETGIAQVPIDIFTGSQSPIAFQMVYVDGSWKLEPHTFSSYIRLSALLGAG